MGKRIIVILASLALLYSFGIHEALSQANGSRPPGVPEFIGGEATIEGESAQGGEVYLKIVWLCIIFLDDLDDQSDITSIVDGLNANPPDTTPLALEFLDSTFCQNYDPPLVLPGPATVNKLSPNEWEVTDPSGKFRVIRQDIKIWQGGGWMTGYSSLQVKMHNCKIASSLIGGGSGSSSIASSMVSAGSSPYSLVLEVNDLPEDIWWGQGTYTLIDPGSANVDDGGYFYIKKDGIERRVTRINDQLVDPLVPHYIVGDAPFSILALDAPELIPLDIPLYEGLNLFSIPFKLANPDISVVLADIFYSVETVFAFRGGNWYGAAPVPGTGTWDDQIGTIDGGETFVICGSILQHYLPVDW